MRAIVFYVYLSLLLFCGGYALYASTHYSHTGYSAARKAVKKQRSKLAHSNQNNPVIDDAEIDLDEDTVSGADDQGQNKIATIKSTLPVTWYLTFCSSPLADHCNKPFKISVAVNGDSSPIYITQRVLRI